MGNKRRPKANKQRGMNRRLARGKKPMSAEEKEARKKMKEKQREENKARVAKKQIK